MSDPGSNKPKAEDSEERPQEGSTTRNEQDNAPNEDLIASSAPVAFSLVDTLIKQLDRSTNEGISDNQPERTSSLFPPGASADDMLVSLTSLFRQLKDIREQMPEITKAELPTASLPTFMSDADSPVPDGPTYRPSASDAIDRILNVAHQSFAKMDRMQGALANALQPPTRPPVSTSSPQAESPMSAVDIALKAGAARFAELARIGNAQTSDSLTHVIKKDEIYLSAAVCKMSELLQSLNEDDETYPYLQSLMGLSLLHLYEIKWDDHLLEQGGTHATFALSLLFERSGLEIAKSAAVVVRVFAYGQRLHVERDGDVDTLDATVELLKMVWDVYKDSQPDVVETRAKTFLRTELAMCLLDQYRSTGSLIALNNSIEHLQALNQESHKERSITAALGMAYYDRFLHCGEIDDLDRAFHQGQLASPYGTDGPISIGTSSGLSTPSYNDENAAAHHLLSLCFSERFKMTLDVKDLDKAVHQCNKAIDCLHPSNTLIQTYKGSLASILCARFEATKKAEDLLSAIHVIQTAIDGSKGVTGRHFRVPLETIQGYFTVINSIEDIGNRYMVEEGIRIITKSRKNFSGAAHIESRIESYLSKSFIHLFRITNNWDDFESGLHHATLAFEKVPEDSPNRHQIGLELGKLVLESCQTGHSTDFDEPLAQFCTIALSSTWPSIRLDAAVQWANVIEKTDPEAALDALTTALEVLPSLTALGEHMSSQYRILSHQKSTIPQRAAICALDAGNVVMAVSCLEKGRNIMWAQSLQLRAGHMLPAGNERQREFRALANHLLFRRQGLPRTPEALKESLRHMPPEHATRMSPLLNLARPLIKSFPQLIDRMVQISGAERVQKDLSAQAEYRENSMEIYSHASLHGAVKRWNALLEEFNELKGALSFDSSTQKDLVPILKSGSIVIVNTYNTRCEGVVIGTNGGELDFQRISFPELSEGGLYALAKSLRDGMRELLGGKITLPKYEHDFLVPVLRDLWKGLGVPLLAHFARSDSDSVKRRVWWYPTGPLMFLPIHAASPCDGSELGLLEHIISSYIPSIHSLLRASKAPSLPFKVLAVGLPETPGHSRLTYAEKEIGALKRQLRDNPDTITTLIGEEAKTYPVISSVSEYTALQISCHATQNEQYPFDSAFYLHDGPLKLSKIMEIDLSRIQFAFLSACLTSAGDDSLPDECIHLAAGMQFAGVGSVVGTMWSVEDRISAAMSTQVYKYLLRSGVAEADMKESAEALHHAIQVVKKSGVPLTYIVPFIHSGI